MARRRCPTPRRIQPPATRQLQSCRADSHPAREVAHWRARPLAFSPWNRPPRRTSDRPHPATRHTISSYTTFRVVSC